MICFSSGISHVVRLCIQRRYSWTVGNGNTSSTDRWSDIMKWGARASPSPSPGELDQGQCAALAEKSGLSVGHLVADCWPGEAADLISRGTGVICVCHQPPKGCKGQMGLKWFNLFLFMNLHECTKAHWVLPSLHARWSFLEFFQSAEWNVPWQSNRQMLLLSLS